MAEGVAQLRTMQYGDNGRSFILLSRFSHPVLSISAAIEWEAFF